MTGEEARSSRAKSRGDCSEPYASAPRLRSGRAGLVALALISTPALADSVMPAQRYAYTQLADPAKERQAKELMATIRCIVCQGQAIIDSDAELAGDMRALIRSRIEGGETPDQIKAWLIERYGSYVTYEPPVTPITWPLWIAPLVLLGVGAVLARGRFRKHR